MHSTTPPRGPRPHLWLLALIFTAAVGALYLLPEERPIVAAPEPSADAPPPPTSAPAAVSRPPYVAPTRVGSEGAIAGQVVDGEGRPAAGARCSLWPGRAAWGFGLPVRAPGAAVDATASGADGRFALPAGAGTWRLEVEAPGHGTWSADHLRPGDNLLVRLGPPSQLAVTVRDPAGAPVPGAPVRLLASFRHLDGPDLGSGRTDDAGRVELEAVGRDFAYPSLALDGHRYVVERVTLDPETPVHSVELTAVPGAHLRGRLDLPPGAGSPTEAAVRVEAYSRGQSIVATPNCDPDGHFVTPAIFAPGETLRVTASAPGLGEVQAWAMIPVDPDAAAPELTLALRDAERLAVGRAVDAAGEPLGGAVLYSVSIEPIGLGQDALVAGLMQVPHYTERWFPVATADADGSFTVGRLGADLQYVLALAPPSQTMAPTFAWVAPGPSGSTVELGDVALPGSASLRGVLRYTDGLPAAGLSIGVQRELIVSGTEFDIWRPTSWWRPRLTTTRSDGSFRVDGLAPGSYDVKLGGELLATRTVPADRGQETLELFVPRATPEGPGRLAGRVLSEDGDPLAGVFVALFDPAYGPRAAPRAMTFSELDGDYELSAPDDRALALRVSDMRGRFVEHEQTLAPLTSPVRLTVTLRPQATAPEPLIVAVVGPDGQPLEGIDVRLEPPENEYCGCVSFGLKTGNRGFAVFEQLADKNHRVIITDPLGRYAPQQHQMLGQGAYVDVVLSE